ncbi:hypothetical protein GR927_39050 [Mycolicibacterium sp. 3033]|nr:hypothetical protein [Mycolicibacterium aurantiacum]
MSTDDAAGTTANDLGGSDDLLSPMEGTDSDDVQQPSISARQRCWS